MCSRTVSGLSSDSPSEAVQAVRVYPPPYKNFQHWPTSPSTGVPYGSAVVLELANGSDRDAAPAVSVAARSIRRTLPDAPIFAMVTNPARDGPPRQLRGIPHVRAVFDGSFDEHRFRLAATCIESEHVELWLLEVVRAGSIAELGALTYLAVSVGGLDGFLPEAGEGLRRRLQKLGLPSLRRWKMVRTAMRAALEMQRLDLTIARAAINGGYSEPSAFRRHCSLLFGASPTVIRSWLGWEPLMARFVGQKRLPPRSGRKLAR